MRASLTRKIAPICDVELYGSGFMATTDRGLTLAEPAYLPCNDYPQWVITCGTSIIRSWTSGWLRDLRAFQPD